MRRSTAAPLWALASGLLFGVGLSVSGLTDASRVRGFFDLAGAWDPSLALVLASAIAVATIGFGLAARRTRTWIGAPMNLPKRGNVSARLVVGSLVLGVGWGIAGLCPGTAFVAIGTGSLRALLFTGAMLGAMLIARSVDARRSRTILRHEDERA